MPSPLAWLRSRWRARRLAANPSLIGAWTHPPGHYYSPLPDLAPLAAGAEALPGDGLELWERIDLGHGRQEAFYRTLDQADLPAFAAGSRYAPDNGFFPHADALALAQMVATRRPRRVVEVGSGWSTAALLDSLDHLGAADTAIDAIEPDPARLETLLRPADRTRLTLHRLPVQGLDPAWFDRLAPGDVLFIDSSHVLKAGSDVAFLLLRVLPRLPSGVLVHVHDIFFPETYPAAWYRRGRAWNEGLAVRLLLASGGPWRILAMNAYAAARLAAVFAVRRAMVEEPGSSLWLEKS